MEFCSSLAFCVAFIPVICIASADSPWFFTSFKNQFPVLLDHLPAPAFNPSVDSPSSSVPGARAPSGSGPESPGTDTEIVSLPPESFLPSFQPPEMNDRTDSSALGPLPGEPPSPAVDSIPDPQSPGTDFEPDPPTPNPIPGAESPRIISGLVAPAPSPETYMVTEGVFDVRQHGAKANEEEDNSKAFLDAWDAACCYSGNSTFYVPEGSFMVGPISLTGPCYNNQSPLVKIKGSLIAPASLKDFSDSNWIVFKNLRGIVVEGEGVGSSELDGQGDIEAWKQDNCYKSVGCIVLITSLKFENVSHGTIRNISLLNGKGFHVGFHGSDNMIVENIKITAPGNSPNTDGIHIGDSANISITSSVIGVGDDCISIGPGSFNISVYNIQCGPGHGISVGSLGKYSNEDDVEGIYVYNSTINGTENGIRVKTWPGAPASKAFNMNFTNIHMINVSNPIIIDQQYCPSQSCNISQPSLVKLSNINIKDICGTYNTKSAVTLLCSPSVACENISLIDISLQNTTEDSSREGRLNVKGLVTGLEIHGSSF